MRKRRARSEWVLGRAAQTSWRRALLGVAAGWPTACGGPAALGFEGDACFRTEDCAEGYVCIDNACSDDLRGIERAVEPPAGSVPPQLQDAGIEAGRPVEAGGGTAADAPIGSGGAAPEAAPPAAGGSDAASPAPISSDAASD